MKRLMNESVPFIQCQALLIRVKSHKFVFIISEVVFKTIVFLKFLFKIFDNGTVKSNVDEKVYTVINDVKSKTLSKGSKFRLYFEAKPDKDAGGNLVKAKFQNKVLDIGILLN